MFRAASVASMFPSSSYSRPALKRFTPFSSKSSPIAFVQQPFRLVTRTATTTTTTTLTKSFTCPLSNAPTFTRTNPRLIQPRISMTSSSTPPPPPPSRPVTSDNNGPTMVRARHILVDSEDMLDTIEAQIQDGKVTFDELARMVSTCTSKERGGDLGWFRRNVMVKDFENAAFTTPPGSTVRVKTEFGWHFILVEQHAMASTNISVGEFAKRFMQDPTKRNENVQLIDCRERSELELACLPNFLNLPMGEYGEWADEFDKSNLGLDKTKETIVMCHHGMRSANFCSFLSQQGFLQVRNLVGGIHAYSKEIDPSVPIYGE